MKELYTNVQIWHAIHELSDIRARYDISNEKGFAQIRSMFAWH